MDERQERRDTWAGRPNVVKIPAMRRTVASAGRGELREAPAAYPCAGRAMRGADVETSYWLRTGVRA